MHPRQYAFKQGYSTEAALHSVVHKLEKAVFDKQLALALFLVLKAPLATSLWQLFGVLFFMLELRYTWSLGYCGCLRAKG